MMNLRKNNNLSMLIEMQKSLINLKETITYYKNISIDDLLRELSKNNINLNEQEILIKYEEYMNIEDTDDYFYQKDMKIWNKLDNKKMKLNSDALTWLIRKVVEKHYDVETLCDPYYILDRIGSLENIPKKHVQEKILGIIMSLVEYGKRRNIHSIYEVLEEYDINAILKEEIRKCHQRDAHFKEVIQNYYDTFEDADHSIYKIKGYD